MDADEDVPMTTPGPASKQIKTVDAGIIIEGVTDLVKTVLSEVINPAVVDAALAKALKGEAVKLMLSKVKVKGAGKGPAQSRSNYSMFVSIIMHNLKGQDFNMTDAGAVWKGLPAPLKTELVARFTAVRELYNAKIKSGAADASLAAELAAYERANNLQPFDYQNMLRYKAAGANGSAAKAAAKPAKAAAAATPAAGAKRTASDEESSSDESSDDSSDDEDEEPPQQPTPKPTPKQQPRQEEEHKHSHKKHKKEKEQQETEKKSKKEKKKEKKDKA